MASSSNSSTKRGNDSSNNSSTKRESNSSNNSSSNSGNNRGNNISTKKGSNNGNDSSNNSSSSSSSFNNNSIISFSKNNNSSIAVYEPISYAKREIKKLFSSVNEGDVHGYQHAICVYNHGLKALHEIKYFWHLSINKYIAVLLACLLHDVDDEKIFGPEHKDLPNARRILSDMQFSLTNEVLEMIDYVSFSKNGIRDVYVVKRGINMNNSTNDFRRQSRIHQIPKWKLIPRDADRLEALGCIGVARCIAFGVQIKRPLYDNDTPRLANDWEYTKLAIRYWLDPHYERPYSTLDYFIQGLIIRSVMTTGIDYFLQEANRRKWAVMRLLLLFSHLGYLDYNKITLITMGSKQANDIINQYLLD